MAVKCALRSGFYDMARKDPAMSLSASSVKATPAASRARTVWLHRALLVATWLLMVWGAATRAARAGLACPDWPLCHGRVIPPVEAAFYPREEAYAVYRVYLEFVHRVLAGAVSLGTLVLGIALLRRGRAREAWVLGAVLGAQVLAGGATVLLRNAPYTVVIHLALALTFLAALTHAGRYVQEPVSPPTDLPRAHLALGALIVAQMLVGAKVSSSLYGLACYQFPLCNGSFLPIEWTAPVAWQMLHRALGVSVFGGACALYAAALYHESPAHDRRGAAVLIALVSAQVLLGAINVWTQVPPVASAAHLGLAVWVYLHVARRVFAAGPSVERFRTAV